MKKIRLYAYLQNNLGDDLMVDILLKRYPKTKFYDLSQQTSSDKFLKYPNFINRNYIYQKWGRLNHITNIVTFYKRRDFFYNWIFRLYEHCLDGSVYIGGSIYMQREGQTLDDRITEEEKKLIHGPLYVIGANFGPYTGHSFVECFSDYFSRCQSVTFRDNSSYRQFSNIKSVRYAPDVVFNLPKGCLTMSGTVLVSVIDPNIKVGVHPYKDMYYRLICDICEYSVKKGKQPVLVSFCQAEGDERAIKHIYSMLNEYVKNKTSCMYYSNTWEGILEAFRSTDFVVASRFHAAILALRFSKPLFAISYDCKTQNVLNDICFENYCIPEEIEKVDVQQIFDQGAPPSMLDGYIANAEGQFSDLDVFCR